MYRYMMAAVIGIATLAAIATADAAGKQYTFALVPKSINNPFFDQALAGCKKAEEELKGAVECLYVGPGEHGGGEEQARIVGDLLTRRVDGIAVSPANAPAMAAALQRAKPAGVPVLTWDSDLLKEDQGLRIAYIGTNNYDIGVDIARLVQQIKPKGGTICIQSGGPAAVNHNERMQGIRDTLAGKRSAEAPGQRLTGQNGWTEADGCPLYSNDDFAVANLQLEEILNKYPDLDAFTATGGFPQFLPEAYTNVVTRYKDKIASGALALVVADTLPVQIDLMRRGLSSGQVGQRPFEMGYRAMYLLKDIKDGKGAPSGTILTGVDVVAQRIPETRSCPHGTFECNGICTSNPCN